MKEAPTDVDLEFPGRPLPASSHLYVKRSPLEEMASKELLKPGSVIRIQAPQRMGKSSFMNLLLDHAQQQGYRVAIIDFQEADESIFASLERTLRWFCANVGRRLKLPAQLDEYWDQDIGAKVSCTIYFEDYLIEAADTPLVLALNEINRIFDHPDIAKDFLPLLRYWHEQSKQSEAFGRLRMVLAHSTEIYVPLQVHQSPFNVGCPIQLTDFNLAQTQELACCYGLTEIASSSNESVLQALLDLVGGSPYRLSLAFYHSRMGNTSLESILSDNFETGTGIYNAHLQSVAVALQADPNLKAATLDIIRSDGPVELPPSIAYKLQRLGIVSLNGHQARISCHLYSKFLTSQILTSQFSTRSNLDRPSSDPELSTPHLSGEDPLVHLPPTKTDHAVEGVSPILGNRYCIESKLGRGGFGTTYLAIDTHRPGQPTCVVKKLERWFDAADLVHARRLFATEAQTL
ncbi:MAG TPA: AAA-like domain-containing protein, partial [Stenomitos sp.]